MTIQLSEHGERLIESLVRSGRYASEAAIIDEALRQLEQRDLQAAQERQKVESLLIAGLDSGPATLVTSADWDEMEREGQRLIAARNNRDTR